MTFKDARIAILEARMSGEMSDLIRRNGGEEAYNVPAVREAALASERPVSTFIDHLTGSAIQIAVFFTGVGVTALLKEAEKLGRLSEMLTALRAITIVCRGPKPAAMLRRAEIPITLSAQEPYTTTELLFELAKLDVANKGVAVVHYGERNEQLTQSLHQRGALLEELCLYEWLLPDDIGGLETLVRDIMAAKVDAVIFTSQIQVRHLFLIAERLQLVNELTDALNTKTIVASVGPTCTGVLEQYGVKPHVVPEHPKMGHLVKALAAYMG